MVDPYDEDSERLVNAREIMRGYMNWYIDSPEDSWRLQRDMCEALGIEEPELEPW